MLLLMSKCEPALNGTIFDVCNNVHFWTRVVNLKHLRPQVLVIR